MNGAIKYLETIRTKAKNIERERDEAVKQMEKVVKETEEAVRKMEEAVRKKEDAVREKEEAVRENECMRRRIKELESELAAKKARTEPPTSK